MTPEINAFFKKYLRNVAGKLKITQAHEHRSIVDVVPLVQQSFNRIETRTLAQADDNRFHYFRRYNVRGTFHIAFYGLPDHRPFYPEMLNLLALPAGSGTEKSRSKHIAPYQDWKIVPCLAQHYLRNTTC